MLTASLAGFGLGLSLIVAIGAQNLFVLRQGIRREHVLLVAVICAVSDAVLIVAGVAGLGIVLQNVPWLVPVVRWAGAAFLLGYGLLAARRALRPSGEVLDAQAPAPGGRPARRAGVVLTCLALTWLNPHVYLDTVFLLGSIAATHGDDRAWFAVGAVIASVVWFFALAFGARLLSRVLATPRAWRVLDALVAVVMIVIAVSLVWP
ncbi:LysE/ArgO family amino acid transporter [Microbacterium imperiale]|uniref:Amino acid transporter n=1 Tax=Microbacterium imperiale TaxID=33884 RepID=A0A9W6M4S4_9MICO|nr:LysE/ArgO family amino acid transporter [Microbacterium imperiale]MBP2421783.1 L-lysine exporter family protein LysE/ArgO [Microbacterium imperiale]MDS0199116.1 LysE/ArgO family amino acid transporter [Microbacterium imperiale]BFE39086.1 LysE/ArgO family amino acid transporter [Microbacterium imperiale]GLJ81077.1 amino acid transporter [Microbacterium imperiale]